MANNQNNAEPIEILLRGKALELGQITPPALLQDANRSAGAPPDPFVSDQVVEVEAVYDLSRIARSEGMQTKAGPPADRLLALEADDGTTLFIRADRLRDDLMRLYPDALRPDGSLDLSVLHEHNAATRGAIDWIWSKLSIIDLKPDAIIDKAKDKARELIVDRLGEQVQGRLEQLSNFSASTLGAKALMWAIESQLAGEPGLYRWQGSTLAAGDRVRPGDQTLADAAAAGPLLILIHGTGSHTAGSFAELADAGSATDWEPIRKRFGKSIFGFEHRTFSESPIDNALALAETLPQGARLALVTHSRGGLVGDLLCVGHLDDALIDAYRTVSPTASDGEDGLTELHETVVAEDRRKLRALRKLLAEKAFHVERYVRVACPARGTKLLSDNLDVFLSGLLSLMTTLVGAVAGPAGGAVLSAFKRIVLEIADKRLDPHLIPGIEAMLSDAPMGALLARTARRPGIQMAVIAGDIEGGNLLTRLGILFTDWMLFEQQDNDLVVDTSSMYAGLALTPGASYLFDQGSSVNHFSYFDNRRTREALSHWLTTDSPAELTSFQPLELGREPSASEVQELARQYSSRGAAPPPNSRPVVVLLPGIMGTHLELRRANQKPGAGNRVWFDPLHLAHGGLSQIRFGQRTVQPEALFDMFYGDLAEHLEQSHVVLRFPYDWRRPVDQNADHLAKIVGEALQTHPSQPLYLLAHSMGGLVARAMIAQYPELWQAIAASERPAGRLVMLGTPNNGSHQMVEALLGKADNVRKLARIDLANSMQEVLDIIAGFPGATQLLPRPGFVDTAGRPSTDYLDPVVWHKLAEQNQDRWFGDGIAGVPSDTAIDATRILWDTIIGESDGNAWRHKKIDAAERITYVYGQADNTACGLQIEGDRIKLLGTSEGDGSVTWASGRLDFIAEHNQWFMPVRHGDLPGSAEYFPAIVELLQTGQTSALGRLPVSRGTPLIRAYDAGPVPYPTEAELIRSLLSSLPHRPQPAGAKQRLAVRVSAMDLRNAQVPVMCGHYVNDPIVGAERQIDQTLVGGALQQREQLGLYPGALGSSAVILMPRSAEDTLSGTCRGALIVGLGEMGELTAGGVTETVRAGVLRYLLSSLDQEPRAADVSRSGADANEPSGISLGTLLIGYNSTSLGSVENFVDAIILGVCEANRQYADVSRSQLLVSRLEFIELYLDTAISAAHAIRGAGRRLEGHLQRLDTELVPRDSLHEGEGLRPRLYAGDSFGYWPRLLVTDADAETRRDAKAASATRIKYVFLSARARAETVAPQRQPGLIDDLVKQAISNDRYDPDLARTLFHLMVPAEFKATARDLERLALVLDGYTANLPWEMLLADDEPLIVKTALVRQLASLRFRHKVFSSTGKTACIIADPSTAGYAQQFKGPDGLDGRDLPLLPGAEQEAITVRRILMAGGYQVSYVPPGRNATEVMTRLFNEQYRILVIAAHGVFRATARDGTQRTGVVLSDGMLLTAAEVGQLEMVPDVAFLNCCHLGQVDGAAALPTDVNHLAYSLARELIEIGVRCVVVAGWAVNDQAARTFAETFFHELVAAGASFGVAIHQARKTTYAAHPSTSTWGAYQAYGDPAFVLERGYQGHMPEATTHVAPEELLAELASLRNEATYGHDRDGFAEARERVRQLLHHAPPGWADLPEVQAALGALYATFGKAGFDAARHAYLRSIAEEDRYGRVPIKAIEQLANLEARSAENLCDQHAHSKEAFRRCVRDQAFKRLDRAIERLDHLIAITAQRNDDSLGSELAAQPRRNLERWSLLGSAYKTKAQLSARAGYAQSTVWAELKRARDAYQQGEGTPNDPGFNPYSMLNRLQLEAILGIDGSREEIVELAETCKEMARRRFKDGYSFWDAIMVVEADLTVGLATQGLADTAAANQLLGSYQTAAATVPKSAHKLDSVIKQLRFLAQVLTAGGDDSQAATLEHIASVLLEQAPGE